MNTVLPLTPTTTKALLDAGYKVNVERRPERIFNNSEFEAVGATLVPEGSWVDAPHDHIIIGLKDLPETNSPLSIRTCCLRIATKDREGGMMY